MVSIYQKCLQWLVAIIDLIICYATVVYGVRNVPAFFRKKSRKITFSKNQKTLFRKKQRKKIITFLEKRKNSRFYTFSCFFLKKLLSESSTVKTAQKWTNSDSRNSTWILWPYRSDFNLELEDAKIKKLSF